MKTILIVGLLLLAGMAEAGETRISMPVPNIGVMIVKDIKDCLDRRGNPMAKICLPESCTDGLVELISAAEGVLPYLRPSDEPIQVSVTLEYRTPLTHIQQLEKEIRDTKDRDAAIKRFRDAVKKGKEGR